MDRREEAMINAALAVLLERAGGEIAYTQTEFAAVRARHGEYRMEGEVDKSAPGEPIIRFKIVPSNRKSTMPVA